MKITRTLSLVVLLSLLGITSTLNAAVFSSPMRDVENPARTPVNTATSVHMDAQYGGSYGNPVFQVPAGKRLVVEYVSINCSSATSDAITYLGLGISTAISPGNAAQRNYSLPVISMGNNAFGTRVWTVSQAVKFYADSTAFGSQDLTLNIAKTGTAGAVNCDVSISGHTIDL